MSKLEQLLADKENLAFQEDWSYLQKLKGNEANSGHYGITRTYLFKLHMANTYGLENYELDLDPIQSSFDFGGRR